MSISSDEFKAAMALRAGGVAILTSRDGDLQHGMTVTDYAGVSVDPPLVLVCADKSSNTLGVIRAGGCFAISLLATDQVHLSEKFASKQQEWERFDGLECRTAQTGAPLLPDCVGSFDCSLEAEHDAGDHVILVGRVQAVEVTNREPLVYLGGSYCSAAPLGA